MAREKEKKLTAFIFANPVSNKMVRLLSVIADVDTFTERASAMNSNEQNDYTYYFIQKGIPNGSTISDIRASHKDREPPLIFLITDDPVVTQETFAKYNAIGSIPSSPNRTNFEEIHISIPNRFWQVPSLPKKEEAAEEQEADIIQHPATATAPPARAPRFESTAPAEEFQPPDEVEETAPILDESEDAEEAPDLSTDGHELEDELQLPEVEENAGETDEVEEEPALPGSVAAIVSTRLDRSSYIDEDSGGGEEELAPGAGSGHGWRIAVASGLILALILGFGIFAKMSAHHGTSSSKKKSSHKTTTTKQVSKTATTLPVVQSSVPATSQTPSTSAPATTTMTSTSNNQGNNTPAPTPTPAPAPTPAPVEHTRPSVSISGPGSTNCFTTCSFHASSTGSGLSYSWSGAAGDGSSASMAWQAAGSYTISVTVTDQWGQSASDSMAIEVRN